MILLIRDCSKMKISYLNTIPKLGAKVRPSTLMTKNTSKKSKKLHAFF